MAPNGLASPSIPSAEHFLGARERNFHSHVEGTAQVFLPGKGLSGHGKCMFLTQENSARPADAKAVLNKRNLFLTAFLGWRPLSRNRYASMQLPGGFSSFVFQHKSRMEHCLEPGLRAEDEISIMQHLELGRNLEKWLGGGTPVRTRGGF